MSAPAEGDPLLALLALALGGTSLPLTTTGRPTSVPAVLVVVPELQWADAPPVLGTWARANLSLRSVRLRAGAPDGYLSLGKGRRTAAPSGTGLGPVEPTGDGGLRLADWERLRRHDRSLRQGGTLGALGHALAAWGQPWTFVATDLRAAAVVADRRGVVARAVVGGPPQVGEALAGGAVAVVTAARADEIPEVVEAAGDACVLLTSVSSPDENRHLGVFAAAPACGLGRGGRASPSTHQAHLATLYDVGITFLDRLGAARPPGMSGSVVRPSAPVGVATLVDRDRRAATSDLLRTPFSWLFVGLTAVGAAVVLRRPRARPVIAWALLAVPPASFLVMAVPWWRWGGWGLLAAGAAVTGILGFGAAMAGRRDVVLGVGALALLPAGVIGIDGAFGGNVEGDAPFGNSTIGAGRFYGIGNIGSGFLVGAVVVAAGLALERFGRRALAPTAGGMAGALAVGGGPWFGADVGGVLMGVPAFGTLLLSWRRGRPSARVLLPVVVATAVVLALFVAVDVSRPPAAQTHLGRAIDSGEVVDAVTRKGGRALATVAHPLALVVVLGAGVVALARPQLGVRPARAATAWSLAVAAVLSSALNDSGLLVGAAVTAVGGPALLAGDAGDPVAAVDSSGAVGAA
ncbi:MAG TPA: hypothetical protein VG455_10510 [Acidimicrobiales bacterium]|nr:hypothetical protein [Acidimicrobiales bacterium]